ncbi:MULTISPECIES: hypothetical protein [Streptomyces]|uniref:Lipoprotein n=1 Tax=Streptomyces huasconensis TaxID=1854574 RepID=A0ABV3LLY3_9ACTN|nr:MULTISPECIES: hypothetical protein [Streptomyces]UFQ18037.1 hypothetical protein J2N69_25250 [Streptomyces huasconensis]WCL87648.1 hypothetical protein PPN52_25250 [Streptomyces sp. JCM 35825]
MNRSRLALTAAFAALAAALAGGCGDPGGLRGAGATPSAQGPTHLWPDLPAPSAPAEDYGAIESVRVKGVRVPGGDLRKVDPADVVRADFEQNPGTYDTADSVYEQTVERLDDCAEKDSGARGRCPVLKAYYRDLTGDGKDDLIVGVSTPDDNLDIRVYAEQEGRLTQIMEMSDAVLGVELAGRALIIRAVSSLPGYEYHTVWSWDAHQKTMLPTRDEIVRSTHARRPKTPRPAPAESGAR